MRISVLQVTGRRTLSLVAADPSIFDPHQQFNVHKWLHMQSTALKVEDEIGVRTVIDNAKSCIDRLC